MTREATPPANDPARKRKGKIVMRYTNLITGASLVLGVACDLPTPVSSEIDLPAARPALAGPLFATGFTSSWTHTVLPMGANTQLASASGVAINAHGWVAGSTEAVFDGQWFSTTHATIWTPAGVLDLGVLPPHYGQQRSWATAINDHGVAAGMSNGANANGDCCVFRAFRWTATDGMQALPLLAATTTAEARGHGINNLGHVVGRATDAAGASHAVMWIAPDQPPIDIGTFGGSAVANAVNDHGQVVGTANNGAFVWSQETGPIYLGDLGGGYSIPYAINEHGHVVGTSAFADGTHRPFLWTPADGLRDLGLPPGAAHAEARGINDADHIAVVTVDVDDDTGAVDTRAFLWVDETWISLASPELSLAGAYAVNDQLQVAGGGFSNVAGRPSAILWDVTLIPTAPAYDFDGFHAPIHNLPAVNRVRAGRAVPVKFALGGNHGFDIFAPGFPASEPVACDTSAPSGSVETTETAGNSSLTFDPVTGQYTWVWKTEKSWAGSCRRLLVRLADGTEHEARFEFTR